MTKLEALRTLAAKVEAGDAYHRFGGKGGPDRFNEFCRDWEAAFGAYTRGYSYRTGWNAYNGSLDAAKALHEAVLPRWYVCLGTYDDDTFEASVAPNMDARSCDRISHCMARAWLLAIIKVLIAEEEALHDRADADAENDVPNYAKCKACGEVHHIED